MDEPVRNDFSGSAQFVVQAGSITGDITVGGLSVWIPPRQLPPASRSFVGREEQLAVLDQALLPGPQASGIAVITGGPGTGKTELALQWAYRSVDAFGDGLIYCDLQGWGMQSPIPPDAALADVLVSLGTRPADLPDSLAGRAALFRSRVAGRKLLLLVDNVRSAADVRSLMPGVPGCSVLVTSRQALPSLVIQQGATPVVLGELNTTEAVELLTRFTSAHADQQDLVTLAELCGRLPLALVIVAERLVARLATAATVVAELSEERERFTRLRSTDEGSDVETVFSWSYGLLDDLSRRVFVAVGVFPGKSFTPPLVAAIGGISVQDATFGLRRLAAAHLLAEASENQFQAHDILRLFASQMAQRELGDAGVLVGRTRLFGYYLHGVRRADELIAPGRFRTVVDEADNELAIRLMPEFEDPVHALRWLDRERLNVAAACRLDDPALDRYRWQLVQLYRGYYFLTKRLDGWLEMQHLGVAAAVRSGDKHGEALVRSDLGLVLEELGDPAGALEAFDRAASLFDELGDDHGRHTMMGRKARILRLRGEPRAAIALLERALVFYRTAGRRRNTAITLRSIALSEASLGEADTAAARLREASLICVEDALELEGAMTQNSLGAVLAAGKPAEAEHAYRSAHQMANACGASYEGARALRGLAGIAVDEATAVQYLKDARRLLADIGSAEVADVDQELRIILEQPPTAD
jgi:tetratricopeptide (TPR) repeat protein